MTDAPTYLDKILAAKRDRLREIGRGDGRPGGGLGGGVWTDAQLDEVARARPCRDFAAALGAGPWPRVIAEFKRASPSLGPIREDADVVEIGRAYQRAGAVAISVLADEHFAGSLDDVATASDALDIPVLCKDFILDKRQLVAARRAGADAVLLIVAALPAPQLRPLVEFAQRLGLHVLCEAHDAHEVDRAMSAGARIIGGNARDLRTFTVDLQRAIDLRRLVPASFLYVAESGVSTPADLARLRDAGVDAVLVGSALMGADDPGVALAELVGRGP
jgi:indole-3-glycerol phosphate synthase